MSVRDSLPENLLSDVKNYLDITWDDDATDRKVRGIIAAGMMYINGKLGTAGNFSSAGLPRTLLMEYARYARDGALDVFENNYQSMILAMQNDRKVTDYVESSV